MSLDTVQTIVLRSPSGPSVAHQLLCIPDGAGRAAACLLEPLPVSFGVPGAQGLCCSLGISFAGLEALGVREGYLRLFWRLAPAFAQGAVRRSVHLGDSGASAPRNWLPQFHQDRAHVVLSWHGDCYEVWQKSRGFAAIWNRTFRHWLRETLRGEALSTAGKEHAVLRGQRIGHPDGEDGEWMHFGFRDGISEVCIDHEDPRPLAQDQREHATGALLLGHVNGAGFNPFALSRAPDKVRSFFLDSSFGVLRPMQQDLKAFEEQLDRWVTELARVVEPPLTRDFVKAKLCGRWPDGRPLEPGDTAPKGSSLVLDLKNDLDGEGCPYGSHVRRMRAAPDRNGNYFLRPLQRRSFPFGQAAWSQAPDDDIKRGQFGHFFCASIEDQFEHLLGQWGARPPLGLAAGDNAQDPFTGPHEDAAAALSLPLQGKPTQSLKGFRAWTTTLGTVYAWHPGKNGLHALLTDDFVPEKNERPWL